MNSPNHAPNSTYIVDPALLPKYVLRAREGARWLLEVLWLLKIYSKGKVRRGHQKSAGPGWYSTYEWVFDCPFCISIANSPACAGLPMCTGQIFVECDGYRYVCVGCHHDKDGLKSYLLEELKKVHPLRFEMVLDPAKQRRAAKTGTV